MCFCMVYTYVFDDLVQHGWVEGDEEGEGDGDSEVKGELEGLQSNTLPAGTAASTKHNELTQLVHVVAAPLSLSLSLSLFSLSLSFTLLLIIAIVFFIRRRSHR